MTKNSNSGILQLAPEEDSGVKVYTDWESVRIQAAIQFTSDFISSSVDTSGVSVSELAVRLADNLVEKLKERSQGFSPTEQQSPVKPSEKPFGHIEFTTHFERIQPPIETEEPPIEFKFHEGELVTPKKAPGKGYEIMNRKYTINDKVAYFCKHLGWMFESELQRYDPNEPKEPTR